MTESVSVQTARKPRVAKPRAAGVSAVAEKRARRALLLSLIAMAGSAASLFFNEAFVAFCGI